MTFPNYEAAMAIANRAYRGSMGPTSGLLKDIVDAALGDEPLYRLTEHAVVLSAGRGEFEIDGTVLDVWPLEDNDGEPTS